MKTRTLLIVSALALLGCKKRLAPTERDAWLHWAERKCHCANVSDRDEAQRCLQSVGRSPQTLMNDLDDDSNAFISKVYVQGMECDRFASRR